MIGSMATIPLPGVASDAAAAALAQRLYDEDGIEVPDHRLAGARRTPVGRRAPGARAAPDLGPALQRDRRLRAAGVGADPVTQASPAGRRVDRPEEPARHTPDPPRLDQPGVRGHPGP